jgi:Ca-activated chloride channel family protein
MKVNAHLDVDLVALETEDEVTVMLELEAPQASHESERAAQTLVVVLDRSGSMTGPRLDAAKHALAALVTRLDPRDSFGVVVFDDEAAVAVPAMPMADHDRAELQHRIASIQPGDSTDLASGYLLGSREARRARGDTGATVLIVSDGLANHGETSPDVLGGVAAQQAQSNITTSTLGVGLGYDEVLRAAITREGNGEHQFAAEADDAVRAISSEVDGLLGKSAQNVQAHFKPGPEVTVFRVYGRLPGWSHPDGGIVLELGDMFGSETRKVLVKMPIPGMAALGLQRVVEIELRYVALPDLTETVVTIPVMVNVVPADVANGRVPNASVRVEQLIFEAQDAKEQASASLRSGDDEVAKATLKEASEALRDAAKSVDDNSLRSELEAEADEIDQLAQTAESVGGLFAAKEGLFSATRRSRGKRPRFKRDSS